MATEVAKWREARVRPLTEQQLSEFERTVRAECRPGSLGLRRWIQAIRLERTRRAGPFA